MMAALLGLAIDLAAVVKLFKKLGDAALCNLMPHGAQRRRELGVALRHPKQRSHRIAQRRGFDDPSQIVQKRCIRLRKRAPSSARTTNHSLGKPGRLQILQTAADRASRYPRRPSHGGNAAVTCSSRLSRGKQPASTLIKAGMHGFVAQTNRILVNHCSAIRAAPPNGNPRPPRPTHRVDKSIWLLSGVSLTQGRRETHASLPRRRNAKQPNTRRRANKQMSGPSLWVGTTRTAH